jgi:alkylation response protein AidB-like acyl-CoA dehydrogenase
LRQCGNLRHDVEYFEAMAIAAVELTELEAAVRGVLDRHWPSERRISRDSSGLGEMWQQAIEHDWLDLGGDEALPVAIRVLGELGRANCGIPLLDAFVASAVLSRTDYAERIAVGEVTVIVGHAPASGLLEHLEGATLATHALVLPHEGSTAELYAIDARMLEPTPSIAPQGWTRLTLPTAPELQIELAPAELEAAARTMRLGLAARALGAARRAHELAVEHASTREQFGQPIGRFQAVSHRAATCAIDLASSALLLDDAVEAVQREPDEAALAVGLATSHALAAAPRVILGALHTLGGMGFHEEHEGAWLFRRVYADVARAVAFDDAAGDPSRMLIEEKREQPSLDLGPDANAFRDEVRMFFAEHWDPVRVLDEDAQYDPELRRLLVERGWLGAGWPKEWGGQERSPEELLALTEEIRYRGVPVRRLFTTVNIVGGAIVRHGTDEQKQRYLPGIKTGETLFCLGYSEPGAGSDLASLRTSARKTEGGWIVNGQKIFTTFGHRSHFHWLAVRTDADAKPPHAGISVFIVPLDSGGITIQENHALNGETTCTVFYDDVFVPDEGVVGQANDGWKVIGTALSVERIQMGGNVAELRGILDGLLTAMREDPDRYAGAAGSWQREAIVEIAAWLRAVRLFVVSGLRAMAAGESTRLTAAMAKVAGGETAEKLADVGLRILGPNAALAAGAPGSLLNGSIERMLRLAPMYVIGGGTNDIQRNLIARELGLPR